MDPLCARGLRFPGERWKPVPRELLGSQLRHHRGLEVPSSSWTRLHKAMLVDRTSA